MTKTEAQLKQMSYEELLRMWRYAALGDLQFQGRNGEIFKTIMFEKRNLYSVPEQVEISKRVGW